MSESDLARYIQDMQAQRARQYRMAQEEESYRLRQYEEYLRYMDWSRNLRNKPKVDPDLVLDIGL